MSLSNENYEIINHLFIHITTAKLFLKVILFVYSTYHTSSSRYFIRKMCTILKIMEFYLCHEISCWYVVLVKDILIVFAANNIFYGMNLKQSRFYQANGVTTATEHWRGGVGCEFSKPIFYNLFVYLKTFSL